MNNIEKARKYIQEADGILITAGAGMGVDSGLPDFRGNEGFWKAYPPIAKLGLSFSEMANPSWFEKKPSLAWAFYGHRLNLYRDTTPHDGFKMLLDLAYKKDDNYFIFTSNVDGQFQKAGFSDYKIAECHGSIMHMQCSKNCSNAIWSGEDLGVEVDMEKFRALNMPHCPNCGAVARPNILMFGDWNWNGRRVSLQEKRLAEWLDQNRNSKIVIIEMGAGEAIPTIRHFSEEIANGENINLIRINPRDSYIDDSLGVSIEFGSLEALGKII